MSNLYSKWLEAHDKGIIAPEWKQAHIFLTWATAKKYKPEYGYEGDFTPENLLAAIPKGKETEKETLDAAMNEETLSKMTVADIKELAEKMEIDLKGLKRKDEIINAILEAG